MNEARYGIMSAFGAITIGSLVHALPPDAWAVATIFGGAIVGLFCFMAAGLESTK
jgi:hypothetical protein